MPFLLTLLILLTSPAAEAPLSPGHYRFTLKHEGIERSYLVHLPPAARIGKALPVVLNFHGGGGSAEGQETYSQMDGLADREGFIVVYPNGTGRLGEKLLTFNAGTCCGYAETHQVDDVGFTRALVDDLGRRTPIDHLRIYATGMSNGAMMAYRLAAEAADLVAAIAPVSGSMVLTSFNPSRPVPIMHTHSVDDPRALYNGGLGPPFPMTNSRVEHPAVETQLAKWAVVNGCSPAAPLVKKKIVGSGGESGVTATRLVWQRCKADVVLWKLTGSGHVWPGSQPTLPRILCRSTSIIDVNQEMWVFFVKHPRPAH